MNLIYDKIFAMNTHESGKNWLADRLETVGGYVALLGFAGAIVSGIAFIVSEPNLSAEAIQRLSTQLNGFFEVAFASTMVGGAGASAAILGGEIRKK